MASCFPVQDAHKNCKWLSRRKQSTYLDYGLGKLIVRSWWGLKVLKCEFLVHVVVLFSEKDMEPRNGKSEDDDKKWNVSRIVNGHGVQTKSAKATRKKMCYM